MACVTSGSMPLEIACGHQASDQTKISLSPPTPTSHEPRARATARPSSRNEAAPYTREGRERLDPPAGHVAR